MTSKPSKVTVLMPVFNGARYLRQAIDSILNQTYRDLEFLIVNDGSEDPTQEIIESYRDPRIRVIHHLKNQGLACSLNEGMDLARGEYIARMDADDVSLPHRLSTQGAFMDEHAEVDVCGSFVKYIRNESPRLFSENKRPVEHQAICARLFVECCISHPTVIMRRSSFKKHHLYYDRAFEFCEDYELFVRAKGKLHFHNIPKALLYYRVHDDNISSKLYSSDQQRVLTKLVWCKQLLDLGITPTQEERELHCTILNLGLVNLDDNGFNREWAARVEEWLNNLLEANQRTKVYQEELFSALIEELRNCFYLNYFYTTKPWSISMLKVLLKQWIFISRRAGFRRAFRFPFLFLMLGRSRYEKLKRGMCHFANF